MRGKSWRGCAHDRAQMSALVQIGPHARENTPEHVGRKHAGVGVVARAMIAVEKRKAADCVPCAMRERRRGEAEACRSYGRLVRNAPERHDRPKLRHCD